MISSNATSTICFVFKDIHVCSKTLVKGLALFLKHWVRELFYKMTTGYLETFHCTIISNQTRRLSCLLKYINIFTILYYFVFENMYTATTKDHRSSVTKWPIHNVFLLKNITFILKFHHFNLLTFSIGLHSLI